MLKFIKDLLSWNMLLKKAGPNTIPSKDYMLRVALFDQELRKCMITSNQLSGISSPTSKHFYASVLFTVLCSRSVSLAIITPHSPWADKKIEHWDYATIAAQTRSILETRLAFFYLCIENCDQDEWECRWNIFNLHDCQSRRKMFQDMQPSHEDVEHFEKQAEEIQGRLRGNPYFGLLPEKQQKKYLKGESAYIGSLEEISANAGIDRDTFRWVYRFFSNHVHALPISFYRMKDGDRGRGVHTETEEKYICLCLSMTSSLLADSRKEFEILFKKIK